MTDRRYKTILQNFIADLKGENMELHAVNVGYGDAFFFEWNGHSLLLDTGSGLDGEYCEHPERVDIVSFLIEQKVSRIDTLIISHIHEDHVGKLKEVLEHFSVEKLWIPMGFMTFQKDVPKVDIEFSKNSSKYFYKSLQDFGEALVYCKEKGIPIDTLAQGDSIELDGLRIEVLGAKDSILEEFLSLYARLKEAKEDSQKEEIIEKMDAMSNHTCMLLKIRYKALSGLFCGDNTPMHWDEAIQEKLSDITWIKIPHHGQVDSLSEHFMRKMPLEFCLTTASSDRRYNSANPEVYKALRQWAKEDKRKLKVLFTDPSTEYSTFSEVKYGNRSICFSIGAELRYQYEK